MPSVLYNRIAETAEAFANSYAQSACGTDITALSSTLTPTCRRHYAPNSLLIHPPYLDPSQTNSAYQAQVQDGLVNRFVSWNIKISDLIVDEVRCGAVVRVSMRAVRKGSGKEYHFDQVFVLWLEPDGGKVNRVVEWVDLKAEEELAKDEGEDDGEIVEISSEEEDEGEVVEISSEEDDEVVGDEEEENSSDASIDIEV